MNVPLWAIGLCGLVYFVVALALAMAAFRAGLKKGAWAERRGMKKCAGLFWEPVDIMK